MLLAPAALLLLLLALSALLPQLPGQLRDDPVAATRWVNAEVEALQPAGGVLRALGFFDLMRSPLFVAVGALLLLVALVQLADGAAVALGYRRLRDAAAGSEDAPLELPPGALMQRLRAVAEGTPAEARERLSDGARDAALDLEPTRGTRLLGTRNARMTWLRLLLPAGLLVSLAALGVSARLGWDVHAEALAPGAVATFQAREVTIDWSTEDEVVVEVGGERVVLPAEAGRSRVAGAGVTIRRGPPALILESEEPLLALPGAEALAARVGVVLPQGGSEQVVLLPQQGAGIRLLLLPGDKPSFLAEAYGADDELPFSRLTLDGSAAATLPTPADGPMLTVRPATGLDVQVRQSPWLWLLVPGLLLALAGLPALWWRPALFIAEVEPWPTSTTEATQSMITLQATEAEDLRAVAAAADIPIELPEEPPSDPRSRQAAAPAA
jgi:hypothetical protein